MSETGGAPAPADSTSAPVVPEVQPPNPISTEPHPTPPEPKEPEKPKEPTAREALQRAAEKVDAQEKTDPKPVDPKAKRDTKPEPEKKDGPTRADDGKFAAKDKPADADKGTQKPADGDPGKAAPEPAAKAQEPASDAPARFSADAKAAWKDAPEPVKAEVHRAIRETEAGINKYREAAEAYEPIRPYADLAKQHGTTVKEAMDRYVGLEQALRSNDGNAKMAALQDVFDTAGISPRDFAAAIMGQKPEQAQSQNDATIRDLRGQIAELKQQIGGVTGTLQQQRVTEVRNSVAEFAAAHPRFEELSAEIAKEIKAGHDLPEAYSRAERLIPAPAPQTTTAPKAADPDLTAQTLKGSKSIAGAPTPGSNPASKQPSSSIRDALKRAAAAAG